MRAATLIMTAALLACGCGSASDAPPIGSSVAPVDADDRERASEANPNRVDADAPPLVAALGDSITAGTPTWDPDGNVLQQIPAPDETHQWPYWAGRDAALEGVEIRNCGVNRERTEQVLARLDTCADGARVVVLQAGINDIAQGGRPEDAARNLLDMTQRARLQVGSVVLVDVLPWNAGYPQYAPAIRDLNRRIRAIAKAEGVAFVSFHELLEDPKRPGRMRSELTIDGSHPSTAGHRVLGRALAQVLARELDT